MFDNRGFVIWDEEFLAAQDFDKGKYQGVQLGKKEAEVMRELVFKHRLFRTIEQVDFQGACNWASSEKMVIVSLLYFI